MVCRHSNKTIYKMNALKNDIEAIIQRYDKEESLLDKLLEDKESKNNSSQVSVDNQNNVNITLEDAIKRNKEILQNLEITKARLRSKAIFSPTEIQWDAICERYQQAPSLPITTWRCHLSS